jgi:hypothetical protein
VKCALLSLLLLAGCSSNTAWQASFGHPNPGAQLQIDGGAALAAIAFSVIAVGISEGERGGMRYLSDNPRFVPEMAPNRKVSEQDCSKPIDYTLGNIRCK